jgi:hypothetical protein
VAFESGILFTNTAFGEIELLSGGTLQVDDGFTNDAVITGIGTIDADVVNSGRIIVGGTGVAGVLTVQGNFTQTTTGIVDVELSDINSATPCDTLTITGTAELDGTLNVTLLGGFTAVVDDSYQILAFASAIGDFTTYNLPDLGGGLSLVKDMTPTGLELVVSL